MNENKNDNSPKRYPTQLVLTIRVLVGAYVLYSVYEVMTSGEDKSMWMYLAVAFIAVAGTVILVWALKMLICGQYEGGKADKWSQENQEVESVEDVEVITEADNSVTEVGVSTEDIEEAEVKEI